MRQRGFTLIELVVTLTVLGLLLALGMPSMGDWMRSLRIRNAAESTQNGLGKARMEAMRKNQVTTYWMVNAACALASNSASWVVSLDDPTSPAGHCADTPSATVAPRTIENYSAGDGAGDVAVTSSDAGGNAVTSISFNGFGQMVSPAMKVTINLTNPMAGSRPLNVTISPGGAIRMCDPNVAAGDTRACS